MTDRRISALLAAVLGTGLGLMPSRAQVTLTPQGAGWTVAAAGYEALVGDDGCLSNLKLGGAEFLAPGVDISRGSYFHQGGTLKLGAPQKAGDTALTAESDKAAVRYDFRADGMTWTVANRTDQPMHFFIVFDTGVKVAMNADGQAVPLPVRNDWTHTVWFRGAARLELTGSNSLWGPWGQGNQVWDAALGPKESRTVEVKAGQASAEEAAKVAGLTEGLEFSKPGYTATVAKDGCLISLKVAGQEFLRPGAGVSRGGYFYQDTGGGLVAMARVAADGADAVAASSDKASVRYEFTAAGVTLTVKNTTAEPMFYYMVFDPQVTAMLNEKGEFQHTPVAGDAKHTVWFRGQARLELTGSERLWGPWVDGTQVWQATLAAGEERRIEAKAGTASAAEAARVTAAATPAAAPADPDILLLSPRPWQVFQRRTAAEGPVLISGRLKAAADKVEYRITGTSKAGALPGTWKPLPVAKATRGFQLTTNVAAGGWYTLEVRAAAAGQTLTANVEHVGVGEVFVGAGQSNSTNCGQLKTTQTSGLVSAFSGTNWQPADDPQPGAHDKSGGGSFWPAFGDALAAKLGVPIGVAVTGHGGTSVNQWQPDGELFAWMMTRVYQLGPRGFRAVLWHQGESDVGMTADEYYGKLRTVIAASKAAAGWEFPWVVAQVSYLNPDKPSLPTTRAAQKRLWDDGVAMEGPDTDTLGGDNRDFDGKGIHFSPKGLKAHGEMWAEKVTPYLQQVLEP